jgi:hypothetical protein
MPLVILHHLLNISVQLANKRGLKKWLPQLVLGVGLTTASRKNTLLGYRETNQDPLNVFTATKEDKVRVATTSRRAFVRYTVGHRRSYCLFCQRFRTSSFSTICPVFAL